MNEPEEVLNVSNPAVNVKAAPVAAWIENVCRLFSSRNPLWFSPGS
jgi:hypothetical protein